MTDEEVERIVKQTLVCAIREGWLKEEEEICYINGATEIRKYFRDGDADYEDEIERLRTDPYFDILTIYFKERKTIEQIAGIFGISTSTVFMNKKRLCIKFWREVLKKK